MSQLSPEDIDPSIAELEAITAEYQAGRAAGKPRRRQAWWRAPQEGAETDFQVILAGKLRALEAPLATSKRRRRITPGRYRQALSEALIEANPRSPDKVPARPRRIAQERRKAPVAQKLEATKRRLRRTAGALPVDPRGTAELRKAGTVAPRQLSI